MSIFHKPAGSSHQMKPSGGSAKQNTAVGSGSRPTKSTHKIHSSAPEHPHKLGRADGTKPLK